MRPSPRGLALLAPLLGHPYRLGILMAIFTALSWSVLAIGLKVSLDHGSAGTIAWFRFFVAFLISLFFYLLLDQRKITQTLQIPAWVYLSGAALAFNYYGFMKGVELTGPSNTQILIQLGPLGLALTGIFVFKEQFSRRQWVGIGAASCGFILFYSDQIASSGSESLYQTGVLWIIAAAVTWTLFAAIQKVLSRNWSAGQINLSIYGLSSLLLLPTVTWSEILSWDPIIWLLMLALGANTLIAYACFGLANQLIPSSKVSLIITANPLLTLAFMGLLSQLEVSWIAPELIGLLGYLGALLVVTGVAMALVRQRIPKAP